MMTTSQMLVAGVAVCYLIWRAWRSWKMSTFQRWKIPGPKPDFIHGNVKEIRNRGLPQCHIEWAKTYGKVYGYYIGGTPMMVINDTDVLKHILKDDFQNFENRPISSNGFMVNVGMEPKTLIFSQNEQWKTQRTVWKSFFNPSGIKRMMPAMNQIIDRFLSRIPGSSSSTFDIYQLFQELTVDTMGQLMLGLDTDSLGGNQHPLITTFRGFLVKDSGRKKFPVSTACFPEFQPMVLPVLKVLEEVKKALGLSPIHEFIHQCKKHIQGRRRITNNNAPRDFLQVMLESGTPEETVIADCFSLLFGGYETVSITLAYAVNILAKQQHLQDKLRAEIQSSSNKHTLTEPANFGESGLLDQIIEEVLRCHNPVPGFIRRRCSKTVRYADVTIPKGTVVQVPMSCLHMDSKLWSEPDQFKPERFKKESKCEQSSLAHIPFGFGRRNCVAMQFAMTMIKMVMNRLVADFSLLPPEDCPQDEIPVSYSIIRVVPSQGVYLRCLKL